MHLDEHDTRGAHVPLGRRPLLLAGMAALAVPRLGWSQSTATAPALDVPYVPTPEAVVDRMLELARVGRQDIVYDLGCGDGRIVITACKRYGARGVGIDLNPVRIDEARSNAKDAGVADRVEFRVGNLFEADFSPASVVTLYLLPDINVKLRPQLWRQLKVGTRVVSHAFDMGPEWKPERTDRVDHRTVHLWTIKPEHKRA